MPYSNNVIPQMTADNAPFPWAAFASSVWPQFYSAHGAFDKMIDTITSSWASNTQAAPWIIGIKMDRARLIGKYAITSRYTGPHVSPKSWIFQGSNNGTSYVDLHTVSNQPTWTTLERREFTFSNNTSYQYFRLYITEIYSGSLAGLAELEMMEILIDTKYLFQDISSATIKTYNNGWIDVGSAPVTQAMFENSGMSNLDQLQGRTSKTWSQPMSDLGILGDGRIFKSSIDLSRYPKIMKLLIR